MFQSVRWFNTYAFASMWSYLSAFVVKGAGL